MGSGLDAYGVRLRKLGIYRQRLGRAQSGIAKKAYFLMIIAVISFCTSLIEGIADGIVLSGICL